MAAYAATPADVQSKRSRYQAMLASLKTERSQWDAYWQDIANLLLPTRPRFFVQQRNKVDRRGQSIIDNTGKLAIRTLQAGMNAGLTSPARPWMRLTTPDPSLAEFQPVKTWLHLVTQRMRTVFLQSNLYNALPLVYGDMGTFGTSAVGVLEDDQDLMRAYSYPLGSFVIGLDKRGVATTFAREYMMTTMQIVDEFARVSPKGRDIDRSKLSAQVLSAWDQAKYDQAFEVCWYVSPNEEYDANKLDAKDSMRWSSCHFEKGAGDTFLRESGFNEFPVLVPRWEVTGEDTYGTDCPGMTALGDVRQLQAQQKEKAKAIQKMVTPPVQAPPSARTQKTSLLPGDISYIEQGQYGGIRPIHEVSPDLSHFVLDLQEVQFRIRRAFFEDLFLMLATSDSQIGADRPTAREIEERHEEKLLALGPVLERTNDELLDPLIDRTFGIMMRAGLIPEPPQELQGVNLRVEYISIMAQAQKLVGVAGQDRFLSSVTALVEAFPQVRHKVRIFQAIDDYADMLGVNPELVIADEEAQASLEAERQAAQQAQAAEQLKLGAQAANALGKTPMTGDTALQRLVEGAAV